MRAQLTTALILAILVAILALLNPNPDLLARQVTANLFGYAYDGPLVVLLIALVPGSWLILLVVAAVAELSWRRRARLLARDLAARDQEIVGLKALAFDHQQQPPAGAKIAEETRDSPELRT